jgi:hypothetical protein
MIKPDTCSNCIWWCAGMPALATATRHVDPTPGFGACQIDPPQVLMSLGRVITAYPETNGDREGCGQWTAGYEEPDDPERDDIPEDDATVVPFEKRRAA